MQPPRFCPILKSPVPGSGFRGFLFWGICWLAFPASAQIQESDTVRFQFRAGAYGNYQSGNVEMLSLRTRLEASWVPVYPGWVLKTQNQHLYQEFFRRKADDDFSSRNFLYWRPERRVYPFGMGFVSTSFRRKVDLRYFAGAGATIRILKSAPHSLKFSVSAVWERSRHALDVFNLTRYNGDREVRLARATAYLAGQHTTPSRKIRFFYDLYYQPAFRDRQNYRWLADAGIELPLWRGISFNVLYLWTHENLVARGVKKGDRILTAGLNWNFKTL